MKNYSNNKATKSSKTPPYIFASFLFLLTFTCNLVNAQTEALTLNMAFQMSTAELTRDAQAELDKLVLALDQFPKAVIEVASHTDSRASFEYNMNLSDDRAAHIKTYLVQRGIHPDRIENKGYGETKPLNNCIDGTSCSEENYQKNRRTEIKVIKGATNSDLSKAMITNALSRYIPKTNIANNSIIFNNAIPSAAKNIQTLQIEKVEDFKTIKVFFMNNSGNEMVLNTVRARDYSIVVNNWSKHTLKAGEKGWIEFVYDPTISKVDYNLIHSELIVNSTINNKKNRNILVLYQADQDNNQLATIAE